MHSIYKSRTLSQIAATAAFTALVFLTGCKTSVTTYHYDNLRTGWNSDREKTQTLQCGFAQGVGAGAR